MKKLDDFLTALTVALAAILATTTHAVEDALHLPLWAKLATDAIVIGLALTIVKGALAVTLLEAEWLRRRLLGREYVEGTWVDVVFYPDRAPRVGIVHIGSHGSGLVYHGENLDLRGHYLDHFKTEGLKVDFPRLQFSYEAEGAGGLAGVGAIVFDRRQAGPPARYSGYCLDAVEQTGHRLIGVRVNDPVQARLEHPATRVETALEIAAPLLEQALPSAR